MEQIAQQWPLLAGFLLLAAALLRVVQSLYEARLRDWQTFAEQQTARAEKAEAALVAQTALLEELGRSVGGVTTLIKEAVIRPRPKT